ncbi:MAG: hypothetical protein IID38_01335 [Planctomycetes bacterium]|nr:hypothetical protein [Planctomycetota bacterium]
MISPETVPCVTFKAAARVVMACAVLSAIVPATRADQVVVNRVSHTGAKIVGFGQGRLRFRADDGTLHAAWIDEVDWLIVDRGGAFADLNEAERYLAAGELDKALVRYRRALAITADFWADLVTARLLMALDAAGRIDQTVMQFIRLLGRDGIGPVTAARLIPQHMPSRQDGKAARALGQLNAALRKKSEDAPRALLSLVRFELLRRSGDPRAERAAVKVAKMRLPPSSRTERAYAIVLGAMNTALSGPARPAVMDGLDRAILHSPDLHVADFLLLKGRVLLRTAVSKEDVIRASWPFLRVVAHMPDDPRTADGLYGAALALDKMGKPDQARRLLQECLVHEKAQEQVRKQAEVLLTRLQASREEPG